MCQKVQNGGGGWEEQGVISELVAAASVLYQGGEGWQCAMARSQGNLPLKQTGLPGCLLLACAFFCPLQAPPDKCWHTVPWLCARAWQTCLQAPHVCAGSAAALELLPCALLGWFSTPCFQQKSHRCACSSSVHAAAGSCGAETWKIASRDLAFLLQDPNSFTETRCILCVRKNWWELFLCNTVVERGLFVIMEKKLLLSCSWML